MPFLYKNSILLRVYLRELEKAAAPAVNLCPSKNLCYFDLPRLEHRVYSSDFRKPSKDLGKRAPLLTARISLAHYRHSKGLGLLRW